MTGIMARARSLWRGLRRPGQVAAEMDEEMRFHVEMEAERLVRQKGMDPHEARRQAAVAFGGMDRFKEEGRDARGLTRITGMALDFKLGLRMLVKYPGLTLVGGLGMAVAVAIGASFFSFIAAMVNPALPLDEGGRVVAIQNVDAARSEHQRGTQLHDLATWREDLSTVEDVGAYRTVDRNVLTADGRAEPMRVAEMSASGFRVARVPPLLGRYLMDEDERPGAPAVVVIGHRVWQTRFGGRGDVVGATVRMGTTEHTVVGVMPEGFAFPVNNRMWAPLRLDPRDYEPGRAPEIDVFGRLAPGASLEQAQAQLTTIGRRIAAANPRTHEHVRPKVLPYTRAFVDAPELTWVFYLLQLLVSMLLVAIAVNVAILVYARTATRAGEIAVRLALGASRARIVAQLFAEALVLSVLAAAVGLAAAWFALRQANAFASRMNGEQVPFWWHLGLSPATVLYVTGLAVVAAVIVGVIPGIKATGRKVEDSLREAGGAGMKMGRTWTVLIVAQVAVAVATLPATAAFAWTELFPQGIDAPEFDGTALLSAGVGMDRDTPPSADADRYERELAARLADRQGALVERLRAEPWVTGVTYASAVTAGTIEIASPQPGGQANLKAVRFLQVEPGAMDVFGATVLSGRAFRPGDLAGAATAVVVNRSFVEAELDGGSELGRRFRYRSTSGGVRPGGVEKDGWYEIVGVVRDFPAELPYRWQGVPTLYHPVGPGGVNPATLVVRTRGNAPETFAGRLREITTTVDPNLRLDEVRSVARRQQDEERTRRQLTAGIAAVALSVILFSAAGIHALMSFTVAQRRKEIGIRAALGAHPRRILGSIFSRALRQLALGAAIGCLLGGAAISSGGSTPAQTAGLLSGVAALMLTVGMLAALGPARRGLRVQPMEALRAD